MKKGEELKKKRNGNPTRANKHRQMALHRIYIQDF